MRLPENTFRGSYMSAWRVPEFLGRLKRAVVWRVGDYRQTAIIRRRPIGPSICLCASVWFCVLHQPTITDNDMQLLSAGGHCTHASILSPALSSIGPIWHSLVDVVRVYSLKRGSGDMAEFAMRLKTFCS